MSVRINQLSNTHPNAISIKILVSIASHTSVELIVLTHRCFHFIFTFIFASIYEFVNSHAIYAIKLAITNLGVSQRICIYASCHHRVGSAGKYHIAIILTAIITLHKNHHRIIFLDSLYQYTSVRMSQKI